MISAVQPAHKIEEGEGSGGEAGRGGGGGWGEEEKIGMTLGQNGERLRPAQVQESQAKPASPST